MSIFSSMNIFALIMFVVYSSNVIAGLMCALLGGNSLTEPEAISKRGLRIARNSLFDLVMLLGAIGCFSISFN